MSEETYDFVRTIYISVCLLVVLWITYRAVRSRKIGLSDTFGVAILAWSAYVATGPEDAIFSTSHDLNLYHDWLITVPLIFISYAVFKHVETDHSSGGNLLEFALLGATSFIVIALALYSDTGEPLSEQMGVLALGLLPFALWGYLVARILMNPDTYFVSMFERLTVFVILFYPLLWALAGYTIITESSYGGILEDAGLSWFDYQSLLISLSFICKVALVVYHSKLLERPA